MGLAHAPDTKRSEAARKSTMVLTTMTHEILRVLEKSRADCLFCRPRIGFILTTPLLTSIAELTAERYGPDRVSPSNKPTPVIRSVSFSFHFKAQTGMALVGIYARIAHTEMKMMPVTENGSAQSRRRKPVRTSLITCGRNGELVLPEQHLAARQSRSR
jgi:hypothetical protein